MLIRIPENLKDKVTFTVDDEEEGGVKVIEGKTLTKTEEAEFLAFRKAIVNLEKRRFED